MELVGNIVVAWLFADFLAGVWHWLEDRYFREDWPLIGKYIAKPNQLHHDQPTAFLQQGYWSRNWTTIVPAGVALMLAIACQADWWLILGLVFVSQANEIHAWAHKRSNAVVRTLQATGIFQSPRSHAVHHKVPFDCRYCVMSDWLNPILDAVRFWFAVEWLVQRVTGIRAGQNMESQE